MATAAVADEQAIEKSEEQLTRISAAVGSNLLFANLEAEAYREVFDLLVEISSADSRRWSTRWVGHDIASMHAQLVDHFEQFIIVP